MKVGVGCDHASVVLKHILMEHVQNKGWDAIFHAVLNSIM